MSNDQEYNGWTNWETWNVALWIDNEEFTYKESRKLTQRRSHDRYFKSSVECFCNETYPNGTPDMDNSIEMDNVNYQEIADAWREEYELENE